MARNGGTLRDESGSSPDWIELLVKPRGGGAAPPSVNLGGYAVTDDPEHKEVWALPDREVPLTRGGVAHVVIFASGRNATTTAAAAPLHASFKLSDGGEYLAVLDAEGQVVDSVTFSSQYEDVSWGRDSAGSAGHLSRPTPGARNSALVAEGTPLLKRVTKSVSPPPTIEDDITVRACLAVLGEEGRERDPSSAKVELRYKVNFERKEYAVRMEPAGGNGTYCGKSGEATGYQEYVGVLRHKGFSGAAGAHPGDMVRWYVTAENGIGASARSPALDVVAESSADLPRYHGTVVLGAKSTLADLTSQVDKLYWFIQEKDKWAIEKSQCSAFPCLADKDGAHEARCSIYFQGRFYDNVKMRQRGISALLWPKKKFKVDFKGANFKIKLPGDEDISVEEFNLQSHWEEPGEETYMRENIASDFFKDAGLPVFETLHVEVVQNGRFYGLYSIVEQIDENFLKRIGYNPKGHLYKAFSGTASNLNDRVPERLMDKVYRRGNRVEDEDDWSDLHALTQSLAGKNRKYSGVEEYLYNHANIPELVNELALQAAILNQDRCTKNYYVYYDTDMEEWSRFPWDLEAVMGISSALGGVPAPDYCMLVCPQFNSPLYCDSDHPQDPLPNYGSPQAKHYVRKATVVPGLETPEKNYNHLTDALLDTPSIREMYLRRLKTIVDKYLATDYLKDRVNHYYGQIKEIAKKDDSKWGTGDIWEGYEQLLKEQLPQRKQQLMSMYAAGGPEPLLPESQDPSKATVEIKNAYVPANGEYMTSIEVHNPHDFAVDVSGWVVTNSKNVTSARQYPKSKSYCSDVEPKQSDYSCKDIVAWGSCEQGSVKKKGICRKSCGDCRLRSGPLRFTLAAGTVIPSKSSLFITDDVVAYRKSLRQHNMFQHAVGPVDGDLKTYSKKDGFAVYNDLNQKVF
ncbi:spore coat protein CotH [Chloropicon primus]|nr:spore coat protein CotH [Chloropicon primus]